MSAKLKEEERYSRVYKTETGYRVECYDETGMVFVDNKDTRAEVDEIAKNWVREE